MNNQPSWFKTYSSTVELQEILLDQIVAAKLTDIMAAVSLVVDTPMQGLLLRRQLGERLATRGHKAVANLRVLTQADVVSELADLCGIDNSVQPPASVIEAVIFALLADEGENNKAQSLATANAIAKIYRELQFVNTDNIISVAGNTDELSETQRLVLRVVHKARSVVSKDFGATQISEIAAELLAKLATAQARIAARLGTIASFTTVLPTAIEKILSTLSGFAEVTHFQPSVSASSSHIGGQSIEAISAPDLSTEVSLAIRSIVQDLSKVDAPQIAVVVPDATTYRAQIVDEFDAAKITWHGVRQSIKQRSAIYRSLELILKMAAARKAATNDAPSESGLSRVLLMQWIQNGHIYLGRREINYSALRKWVRKNRVYGDATKWLPIIDIVDDHDGEFSIATRAELKALIEATDTKLAKIAAAANWQSLGEAVFDALATLHLATDWYKPGEDFDDAEESTLGKIRALLLTELPLLDRIGHTNNDVNYAVAAENLLKLVSRRIGEGNVRNASLAKGIHVSDVREIKLLTFERIYVLGATEGLLPKAKSENAFLPTHLLQLLGETDLALSPADQEVDKLGAIYASVTANAPKVTILRPRGGTNPELEDVPSRFIADEQLGNTQVVNSFIESFTTSSKSASGDAAQLQPAAERDVRVIDAFKAAEPQTELQQITAASIEAWRSPQAGEYFGQLDEATAENPIWSIAQAGSLSATTIDKFIDCRYGFFAKEILGLRDNVNADEPDDFSKNDFGTYFHGQMELYVNNLTKKGILPKDGAGWPTNATEDFINNYFDMNMTNFVATGRDVWHESFKLHADLLRSAVNKFFENEPGVLRADQKLGIFAAELPFGKKGTFSVTVTGNDGIEYPLNGQIDRVDVSSDEKAAAVMDFKTGSPKTTRDKIGMANIRSISKRKSVQDIVYRLAIMTRFPEVSDPKVNFVFMPVQGEPVYVEAKYADDADGFLPGILANITEAGLLGDYKPTHKSLERGCYCEFCKHLGSAVLIVAGAEE